MKAEIIANFLDTKYPHSNAMKDDFIGLQVNFNNEIETILICLDPTLENIKNAVSHNVDMIISHHPLFFGEKEKLLKEDKIKKLKNEILKENNISYYALHTNLDFHYEGLSFWQAEHIGIKAIRSLTPRNEGVYGTMKIKKEMLIKLLKNKFDINNVNAYFTKNSFNKIAVGSGSSGYLLKNVIEKKCDLAIMGEMKWHEWVFAKENNISVIEIGHFTEELFAQNLKTILKSQVKNIIFFNKNKIYHSY